MNVLKSILRKDAYAAHIHQPFIYSLTWMYKTTDNDKTTNASR